MHWSLIRCDVHGQRKLKWTEQITESGSVVFRVTCLGCGDRDITLASFEEAEEFAENFPGMDLVPVQDTSLLNGKS